MLRILSVTYVYSFLASNIVGSVNIVQATNSGTKGLLLLVQSSDSTEVSIRGRIFDLSVGSHAFHVHTTGATSDNCKDAGSHFNPTSVSLNEIVYPN